jgi:hypothetical protein
MSSRSRTRGPSRRHEPCIEAMESRDLLTVMPTHLASLARAARSTSQATPTPTHHEKARAAFNAHFQGPYTTGPGRLTNQALLTFVNAGGTSNQFLHGNVLIAINTPSDPTQPVTGTAQLFDKNVATTGTSLVLDLQGNAPAGLLKPPTQLTWTVDSSSGGQYTNATGQGTLNIIYFPGGRRPARALQAGTAGAVFQGQVFTTGVGNILQFG